MTTETWITLTSDDLLPYLVAPAVTSYQTQVLGPGQDDPFNEHMPSIVAKIRAYIKGCRTNVLSETENSIPRSLKNIACLMIIEAMEGRMAGISLTDRQQKSLDRGYEELSMISKCLIPVTMPDDGATDAAQLGGSAKVISNTCLTTLPWQQMGL